MILALIPILVLGTAIFSSLFSDLIGVINPVLRNAEERGWNRADDGGRYAKYLVDELVAAKLYDETLRDRTTSEVIPRGLGAKQKVIPAYILTLIRASNVHQIALLVSLISVVIDLQTGVDLVLFQRSGVIIVLSSLLLELRIKQREPPDPLTVARFDKIEYGKSIVGTYELTATDEFRRLELQIHTRLIFWAIAGTAICGYGDFILR